jgi:EpsD family peptidyl-prolyl cis-trans isomerase
VLTAFACLVVAACHPGGGGSSKAPVGQVVATVDGEEITLRDLQAELAGKPAVDPRMRKAAEQAALQSIVSRKLIAKAASEQKLDQTPDFALQSRRSHETLLVRSLITKIVADTPTPTREEAESYIASHPDMFSQRKVFDVDQIRMSRPTDPALLNALKPLKTLDEVERLLASKNIEYRRGASNIDAVEADPRLVETISRLPAGEVFVMPRGDVIFINEVKQTRIAPFTGEVAVRYALARLKNERERQTVARQFVSILSKSAGSVRYNDAYKPAKPAARKASEPVPRPEGDSRNAG